MVGLFAERIKHVNNFEKALIALIVFHLCANFIWILLSTAPIPWDQAGHTRTAMQFADFFRSLQLWDIQRFFNISTYYPPLTHIIVAIPLVFFNSPIIVSEIVISLFFAATILLVYLYTKELFRNETTSLLAAALFSFFPIVYEHSRWFMLELPLLTFLLGTLLFIERSTSFTSKRYTKLTLIFAGLTIMTKWLAVIYLIIPFIRAIRSWRKLPHTNRFQSSYGLLWGILIFFIITLPWYLFNTPHVLEVLPITIQGESSDPRNLFSLQNVVFYLYLFINFQLTLFPFLLFVVSSIYLFRTQNTNRKAFAACIVFAYTVFTIISNKDWRYTMPLLIYVAMICANFLSSLLQSKRLAGEIVISAVMFILISYHLLLSFRYPINIEIQRAFKVPVIGWIDYINISNTIVHPYTNSHWPQEDILGVVQDDAGSRQVNLLILVDQERFSPSNFILIRDLLHLNKINTVAPPQVPFTSDDNLKMYLKDINYVVVVNHKIGVEATRNIDVFRQLKEIIESARITKSELISSYLLPNGDEAKLYRISVKK